MASELEVGKVGVGVAPTATLHVNSEINGVDAIVDNPTHNTQFLIKASAANKNSEILFGDSAADDVGKIDYDHNDNSLKLNTNSATRLTIASDGAVDISGPASHATALTVGNSTGGTELQVIPKENESITLNSAEGATAHALILATGGTPRLTVASTGLATFSERIHGVSGISFGQTASASGSPTSQILDHYEAGTFTLTDASGAGLSLTGGAGKYTRIGDRVFITVQFTMPTVTNGSHMKVSGLPFTVPDDDDSRGLVLNYSNKTDVEYALTLKNTDDIEFFNDAGGYSTCTNGSGGGFYIQGHYKV